ncbi:MAG: hypothetical protein ACYS22_20325 [Planctomycetota bacterium]
MSKARVRSRARIIALSCGAICLVVLAGSAQAKDFFKDPKGYAKKTPIAPEGRDMFGANGLDKVDKGIKCYEVKEENRVVEAKVSNSEEDGLKDIRLNGNKPETV